MTGPQLAADRNYILLAALTHVDALKLARSYVNQLDGNSDLEGGAILWELVKEFDTTVPEELAQHLAAAWRTSQQTDTIIDVERKEQKH